MPDMTGYEVVEELKARPDWRPAPLIAVTAYAMAGDQEKVLQSGFDGYLTKPICPETFVKQVEAFLDAQKIAGHTLEDSMRENAARALRAGDGATILVVDDSPVNLSLLHNTLEPSGYRVISAGTVKQAMAEIRSQEIDLILSDLHMPEDSGFEFLRLVKTDPKTQCIPFVLFSASGSRFTNVAGRALSLGAQLFFAPPIEPLALLAIVRKQLKESQKVNGSENKTPL
jgi:two-component system cell cycle response regulator